MAFANRSAGRTVAVVVAAAVALLGGGTGRADDDVEDISQQLTMDAASGSAGVILCGLKLFYPHASTNFPGQVDVKARIDCSSPVPTLTMSLGLYYFGLQKDLQHFATLWDSSLAGRAMADCVSGDYQGIMDFMIEYPPGYRRINDSGTIPGRSVSVSCRGIAGGGDGSGGGGDPGTGGGGGGMCTCDGGFEMPCDLCSGTGPKES
jgi:hypothetical protein